ncbi:hypothetical protein AABM26_15450 [Curtobacterium aetherium]|uniref:hypothetical protein n=1 Tax=Curtobacterium aetherium TaxID=2841594 RepID=UPI003B51A502
MTDAEGPAATGTGTTASADAAARALVEPLLHPSERILWVGRSDPHRMFVDADRYLIPFSALFSTGVTIGLVSAARGHAHPATVVLLSGFVLVGLHMLVGRFAVKRHRKRTQVYVVTTERALITNGRRTRETDARRTDWYVDRTPGHVTVQWDDVSDLDMLFPGGSTSVQQYANTGLDGLPGIRENTAMFDVADGDALVAALREVSGR